MVSFPLFFTACLIGTVACSNVLSVTQFQTSTCADRQAPGIICSTCSMVAVCVKIGSNWEPVLVEGCNAEEGLYCNEYDGGCSTSPGACNQNVDGNFVCNTAGVFPDPFNCRLYHMCIKNGNNHVAFNMECGGAAFSPATGDCSLPLNDTSCMEPQYRCDTLGQMEAWPGNNNIYYVCVAESLNGNRVLRPQLFRCPANQMFEQGQCVQRDWSNMPPGTIVPYECERSGLFPDPAHCRYYYSCNSDLVANHLQCPDGTYFNANTSSCVLGNC